MSLPYNLIYIDFMKHYTLAKLTHDYESTQKHYIKINYITLTHKKLVYLWDNIELEI